MNNPSEGARYVFVRTRETGDTATYNVTIHVRDASYEGRAILGEDGSVELNLTAPDELTAMAHMIAKLTARAAMKKREDGLPPWPEHVTRWRGPGRGE